MTDRYNPQHGANMVDRYIGSAFDIVYAVYKQLGNMPVFLEFVTETSPRMEDQYADIIGRFDNIVQLEASALNSKEVAEQAASDAMDYRDTTQQLINDAEEFKQFVINVVDNTIQDIEDRFAEFIVASGYEFIGNYGIGIEVTEYNQLLRDVDGEFWRLSGQRSIPYITTGAGLPEDDAFVPVGDASLRQDLEDPTHGSKLIKYDENNTVYDAISRNREDFWANKETMGGIYTHYVREDDGTPVAGAECAVYVGKTGVLATGLKDKFGEPLDNPFVSDADGLVQFVADPGMYTLQVSFDLVVHTYSVYFADEQVRADLANPDMGAAMVARTTMVANTVSEMLGLSGVKIGSTIQTKGYHSPGDGGGNLYEVVSAGTEVADGGSYIDLDNGLQAMGLFPNGVNVKQFGAVGDGVTDDTAACQACGNQWQSVCIPEGAVVGVTKLMFNGPVRFHGGGVIKWLTPSPDNMFVLNDAVDVTFEGVVVDVDNADKAQNVGPIVYMTGSGSENFTVRDCKFLNCYRTAFMGHEYNRAENVNVRICGNLFHAGTDAKHTTHFFKIYQLQGCHITDNIYHNLAILSTDVSSGSTNPKAGDLVISGNICREFHPNEVDDPTDQSMILIRSIQSGGDAIQRNLIIANNVIHGGKMAIAVAEQADQHFKGVVISGNVCKNNSDRGISFGRNNQNQDADAVVISGNSCIWDLDVMGSFDPGLGMGIRVTASHLVCTGNSVSNYSGTGIMVQGDGSTVTGNYVRNCNRVDYSAASGGIMVMGARCLVDGNTIRGGGFNDPTYCAGLLVNSGAYDYTTISNNLIDKDTGAFPIAIALSRESAPAGVSKNLIVRGNTLVGLSASDGTIVPRNTTTITNQHLIVDNPGWGAAQQVWNPGVIEDGATASVAIEMRDCILGDIVYVDFAGLRAGGVGNPSQWGVAGVVSASSSFRTSVIGEVIVYLTNNTGSSQTFSEGSVVQVWIERRNLVI